jgi:hypothetical protein
MTEICEDGMTVRRFATGFETKVAAYGRDRMTKEQKLEGTGKTRFYAGN